MIKADPTELNQVVMNLCANAYQAMEECGGTLTISLEHVELTDDFLVDEPTLNSGPFVRLTVSDTGPGMDAATLEQIFNPYYTTKTVGKGTGLGLSVVHGIVKNHGVVIRVASAPGKGATFRVYIPELEDISQEQAVADPALHLGHERILFVDDEWLLADMGKQLLESLGYRVTAVTSSLEALDQFRSRPDYFDLVITDQTMPVMTGTDLAMEILSTRPDIPIILGTGYSRSISREKALAMGIREFMMKPMERASIAEMIRRVLDGG